MLIRRILRILIGNDFFLSSKLYITNKDILLKKNLSNLLTLLFVTNKSKISQACGIISLSKNKECKNGRKSSRAILSLKIKTQAVILHNKLL